jgi:hypothetical protein
MCPSWQELVGEPCSHSDEFMVALEAKVAYKEALMEVAQIKKLP